MDLVYYVSAFLGGLGVAVYLMAYWHAGIWRRP